MGYTLPTYEFLCEISTRLLLEFDRLGQTVRFIVPNLEALFNNTLQQMEKYVSKEKPLSLLNDRDTQARALIQLVHELQSDENYVEAVAKKEKSEKDITTIATTHQIMLGGLVHRYLRIFDSYKPTQKAVSFLGKITAKAVSTVYEANPENSQIYNAIEGILNISPKNKLDPLTIKTACGAFAAYMKQNNRYLNYIHYKSDANFVYYLEQFINKAAKASKPIEDQIKKVLFLTSFAKNIQQIYQNMNQISEALQNKLTEKDLPLNLGTIYNCAKPFLISQDIAIRFNLLLNRQDITDNIDKWSIAEFIQQMQQALYINSQYALFGAYCIVYCGMTPEQTLLKVTLSKALKCDMQTNILDHTAIRFGLKGLKLWFMSIEIDNATVDWQLFEGKDIGKDMFFAQYRRIKTEIITPEPEQKPAKVVNH